MKKTVMVFVPVAAAIALAGCSSSSPQATPVPAPVTTSAPVPTASTPVAPADSFSLLDYEESTQHVNRIQTALNAYGAAVLPAIMNGTWGPRDAFCNQPGQDIATNYISKGYVPKPGDICNVAHSPQYGGSTVYIAVDVVVGKDGSFSNQFTGAGITTATCNVLVGSFKVEGRQDYTVTSGNVVSASARTLAQARALDDQVVNCLNTTRP